jgi:Zn-dependent protease
MELFNFNFRTIGTEKQDFLIAGITLGLAFSIAFTRFENDISAKNFIIIFLPIGLVASFSAFGLHELGHKVLAERFGFRSEFRLFPLGLIVALFTSIFGVIISLPGSVQINGVIDRELSGKISIIGPIINLIIGIIFSISAIFVGGELFLIFSFTGSINLIVALLNMIPFPPLDGFNIIRWNFYLYILVLAFTITFVIILGKGFF